MIEDDNIIPYIIPEYYIDSVRSDIESIEEKNNLLNKLEKMDPIFKNVNKTVEHIETYDSLNNKIIIKESTKYQYIDFDGAYTIRNEENTKIIDLNDEIKDVEVKNIDMNESWGICCCKQWKIIYKIFHINEKNEKKFKRKVEYWQSDRNENKSNEIRNIELKNIFY